jgi:arsenical pump membrane protein
VLAHILLPLIVVTSIALMLVRPRGIPEVYWIGSGALLLILLRLVPLEFAGKAAAEGTDVYLFLIGMMLLSEPAKEQGVFHWLSSVAVRSANGSCARLFALVYGIGTPVTILMSNDATAVVLTPAVLTAIRKARVQPLPYLFACALIANAASFVLPISNLANLVVFHQGMPPLGRWLFSFGVPLGLIAGATLQAAHAKGLLANAVLIGVDLGPNLSVTGSLATILWLLALRKEKLDVSFWDFLRVGVLAMPAALLASIGGAVLMQLLLRI